MEKSERTNKRMNEKMKYPKVVQTSTRRKHSLHLYAYSMYIGRLQSHKKSRAVRTANSYMKTRMLALNLHLNSSTICLWSIFDCWCSQCHRYQNAVATAADAFGVCVFYHLLLLSVVCGSFTQTLSLSLFSFQLYQTKICIKIYDRGTKTEMYKYKYFA